MQLLLVALHAFGSLICQFISLGFNHVWLHAGEIADQHDLLTQSSTAAVAASMQPY